MPKVSKFKYLVFASGILLFLGVAFYQNMYREDNASMPASVEHKDGHLVADLATKTVLSDKSQNTVESEVLPSAFDDRLVDSTEGKLEELDFSSIEELLVNIDDPKVQKYISSLPSEAQESIYLASLKQSVSKRLDEMEAVGYLNSDPEQLFGDLQTLSEYGVMMPGEVESLKAYVRDRL